MKTYLTLIAFLLPFVLSAQIITTIAGNGMPGNTGNGGVATAAAISYPGANVFDKYGNMYITTSVGGHSVRKISPMGIISTIAGTTGVSGFGGDGGMATAALFNCPVGIAVDTVGNLYVCDAYNNRIRKITVATGIISTIAGNDSAGFYGDGGPAIVASLNDPNGICIDNKGNIYIGDYGNARIRKINNLGIITTVAGNGINGYNGDGGLADTSEIRGALTICVDDTTNLYIADEANGRIRKVDTFGYIHTIAGNGIVGFSGDGGMALDASITPHFITFDLFGNIYISGDEYDDRVRIITTTGVINTVAGTGTMGFSGDGGLATSAELKGPDGIITDSCGNLFICDLNNRRIRKVAFNSSCPSETLETAAISTKVTLYPNPAFNYLIITAPVSINSISISNMLGQQVYAQHCSATKTEINVSTLPTGIYLVCVNNVYMQKLIKE